MLKHIIETDGNVIVLTKEEYDTMKTAWYILTQAGEIHQNKRNGKYQYDWDYIKDISVVLDKITKEGEPNE